MSIAESQLAPARPRVSPPGKRIIRDLDHPKAASKEIRYQKLKEKTTLKKLNLNSIELTYLKFIADEFSKSQKLFKGSWKPDVYEYLANVNTDFDTKTALRKAFKFINNKRVDSNLNNKIEDFSKKIEEKFIRTHADKKVIEFMTRLGYLASQTAANPKFPDQHILLLGEHHVGLPQDDGNFLNPPTAWLEDKLGKLREAGYDTLALEVPYDVDEEAWLETGNSLWGHTSKEHIATVKKLRDEAIKYCRKKNLNKSDKGMILFVKKVNDWLTQKAEELATKKSITLSDPQKPKTENTRERWLELARKAEKAGFRILTTDASRKITHEDERIIYFFQDLINGIKEKTEGLKLIEEYLVYKRGLTMTIRDLAMAHGLEQALEISENNVIGLYGANHTKASLVNSRTSAQRVLNRKNIPVVSVKMEFDGMVNEPEYTILDQRFNIQTHERPSIISLSNMPFVQSQKLKPSRNFQVENHRYKIDLSPSLTIGEQKPFDAAVLFANPITKPAQKT